MKRLVALLMAALFFGTSIPSPAFGAAKAGASCTKIGSTSIVGGKKFTCVKSGKKLAWDKGKSTTKAAARNTPAPSQTIATTPSPGTSKEGPKSESVTNLSTLDQGLILLRNQINLDYEKALINVTIEPGIENYLWARDSVDSIKSAKQLLSAFNALPNESVNAYVVWDANYLKPYISPGCFTWAPASGGGACGPRVMWANLGWFGKNIQVNTPSNMTGYLSASKKLWIIGNLQHELGHIGQMTIAAANGNQLESTPAWIREGEAEVFKVLSYANQFNLTYSQSRAIYLAESSFRCSSVTLRDLSKPKSYDSACEYDNGLLALEYLIQKVGNIQALFWWPSKGKGTEVNERFKNAFNLDYDEFLKEADSYIKNQK